MGVKFGADATQSQANLLSTISMGIHTLLEV